MINLQAVLKKTVVDGALVVLYGLFAQAHFVRFLESREPYLLLVVISESLVALMFLIRRADISKSTSAAEWIVGIAGTFLPMLLRPSTVVILPSVGSYVVAVGVFLQIGGLLSLNMSLGIVPANRGIRTTWMYRFVRHPLYASYVVTFSGYLIANYSILNVLIVCGSLVLMLCRIFFEERHLLADHAYQHYAQSVRWRLIPYVF
ncbi:MAG: methyltransferase family protein [Gammaproteobacteria bacterium]